MQREKDFYLTPLSIAKIAVSVGNYENTIIGGWWNDTDRRNRIARKKTLSKCQRIVIVKEIISKASKF
jgi:hypothetical protein